MPMKKTMKAASFEQVKDKSLAEETEVRFFSA